MKDERKTKEQLINELAELRQRIAGLEASETERKRVEEALRESEQRYRQLFEGIDDAVMVHSSQGRFLDCNEAALQRLGYSHEELLRLGAADIVHPDFHQVMKDNQERIWAGEATVVESAHRGKDGSVIPVEVNAHRIEYQGEWAILAVVRDITERKRAEEALQEYSERLEEMVEERTQELREVQGELVRKERLAVLGQLASGVAYELRNPLGAIKNVAYFLNMVLGELEPEPEVKEALEILDKEVGTSEGIINSLLDFARTKAPTRREVDLNDVLQAALSRIAVPESVEVVSQLDESVPTISADPVQLDGVFGNIILNAIQAMPEGGRLVVKTARLSLRAEPQAEGSPKTSEVSGKPPRSEGVAVSFADTGVGIPEENLARIFEPLFTTRAKGIGLGLPLAKALVEGHGGTIEVESPSAPSTTPFDSAQGRLRTGSLRAGEVGEGSTFTVWLPLIMP